MKIEIVSLDVDLINSALKLVLKSQLPYHEYKIIPEKALKLFWRNQITNTLSGVNTIHYGAVENNSLLGIIIIEKNNFDSSVFGFDCFKINSLIVFDSNYQKVNLIAARLLEKVEKQIQTNSKIYHISASINNNMYNADSLFNSLCKNGFYYFQTLLSFGLEKDYLTEKSKKPNFNIRIATKKDANEIAQIAEKNIHYSRFHLDPFFDNALASNLIKASAKNSVIEDFADIVYVAEVDNKIAGYYSAKKKHLNDINNTLGEVIISIIDPNYRGMGIFSTLDDYILEWFKQNTDFAELGTYLGNYPVHKTWIRKKLPLIRGTHQLSKKFIGLN